MRIAGIVAEFNPFHNGHQYLMNTAKKETDAVICVISGNFVQRGDTAILPKFARAKTALMCGADLCAELPVPWSMSTAQNFALGAVSQLAALGADTLYFGSECGDDALLQHAADALLSDQFAAALKNRQQGGILFASARQKALNDMIGEASSLLENPNDTLAVEYICAARRIAPAIQFRAVKRVGASHNAKTEKDGFTTASLLRKAVFCHDLEYLKKHMPEAAYQILKDSPVSDINKLDTAIMARLKALTPEELSRLPDISEGLENRIFAGIAESRTVPELYEKIKTKRYSLARIRRLVLSAFLGIDGSLFKTLPPYVRILGANSIGMKILADSRKTDAKPIITKVSQVTDLDETAKKVFLTENRASDIYSLSLSEPDISGSECRNGLIKV